MLSSGEAFTDRRSRYEEQPSNAGIDSVKKSILLILVVSVLSLEDVLIDDFA